MDKKKGAKESTLLGWYQDAMVEHEFIANLVQGLILTGMAVVAAGVLTKGIVNWSELYCMLTIQSIFITPVILRWFKYLNQLPSSDIAKVILDQFIFSPLFTACIIGLKLYLESCQTIDDISPGWVSFACQPVEEIVSTLYSILPGVVFYSWGFWIPQRYITLKFIPPHLHVVFANVCSFFWNIIFSTLTSVD